MQPRRLHTALAFDGSKILTPTPRILSSPRLRDIGGEEGYDRLRDLWYPDSDFSRLILSSFICSDVRDVGDRGQTLVARRGLGISRFTYLYKKIEKRRDEHIRIIDESPMPGASKQAREQGELESIMCAVSSANQVLPCQACQYLDDVNSRFELNIAPISPRKDVQSYRIHNLELMDSKGRLCAHGL